MVSLSVADVDGGGGGAGLDLDRCLLDATSWKMGNPPGIEGAISLDLLETGSKLLSIGGDV